MTTLETKANPTGATGPTPTAVAETRALVSRFREILREAPGNPEFNTAWDWSNAKTDSKGHLTIPGRDGYPDLKLTSVDSLRSSGKGHGAKNDGISIEFGVSTRPGQLLTAEAVKDMEDRGIKFLKPITPEVERIYEESKLVHELAHSRQKSQSGFAGEYVAFSAQYRYLAEQGVIELPSRTTILRHIQDYYPERYGEEVMVAFNGKVSQETLTHLIGGTAFKAEVMKEFGSDPRDGWSSDYGKALLNGIKNYYFMEHLKQSPPAASTKEKMANVGRANSYAESKLAEFKEQLFDSN